MWITHSSNTNTCVWLCPLIEPQINIDQTRAVTQLCAQIRPSPTANIASQAFPMNYLIDILPRDLLTHLYIYSKLLSDEDIYSLAKCSKSILRLVGARYELLGESEWFFYRVVDIEAVGLQLPWTAPDEKSRYVLECRSSVQQTFFMKPTSFTHTSSQEWVVFRHPLERLTRLGCTNLPFHSLARNEYQHTSTTIGVVTSLKVSVPKSPPPSSVISSSNQLTKVDESVPELPHLRFLPPMVTKLFMEDVSVNDPVTITTYVWPSKLIELQLNGSNPFLFTESMVSNWPHVLKHLKLRAGRVGVMSLIPTLGRIYFPPNLTHIEIGDCWDSLPNPVLAASLPSSLTSLVCSPQKAVKELNLTETSLKRLELRGYVSKDSWSLPESLVELCLSRSFSQSLDQMVFNTSLTHLSILGWIQNFEGVLLPKSLLYLALPELFGENGQTLIDVKLPTGLQTLKHGTYIDSCIYQPDRFIYPPSLTSLQLGYWSAVRYRSDPGMFVSTADNRFTLVLPPALKDLRIPLHLLLAMEALSTPLERLTITCKMSLDHASDHVPERLNHHFTHVTQLVYLEFDFNQSTLVMDHPVTIPDSVETLVFSGYDQLSIQKVKFGTGLKQIRFQGNFNQSLNGIAFPDSLRDISFMSNEFNQPIDEVALPSQLESLSFVHVAPFNQPINRIKFPHSLKIIQLPSCYNQPVLGLILPPRLEIFELGSPNQSSKFTHLESLTQLKFPSSIRRMCLPTPHHPCEELNRPEYVTWLAQLHHKYPYARIGICDILPSS